MADSGRVAESRRLRGGVRVVARLAHVVVARPEAERDGLVRVRLPRRRVRVRQRRARAGRRTGSPRGRSECQNRCTGLVFPQNQPANSSKTTAVQSRTRQKRPTASASYEACSRVLRERSRHRHAEGLLAGSARRRRSRASAACSSLVERRDREAVGERERLLGVGRLDDEPVADEVEADLEPGAVRPVQEPRRQPVDVDVERDVPPVVRGGTEAIFTLPTICAQRWSVFFVASHSGSGSGGSGFISRPRTPTSSTKHQLQSSPGSAERTIGCPSSRACPDACRFGDESQHPIFPQVMAHAEVEPAAADLQALLAAGDLVGQRGERDLVEVGADRLVGHGGLVAEQGGREAAEGVEVQLARRERLDADVVGACVEVRLYTVADRVLVPPDDDRVLEPFAAAVLEVASSNPSRSMLFR